jgi:hypothetical protein
MWADRVSSWSKGSTSLYLRKHSRKFHSSFWEATNEQRSNDDEGLARTFFNAPENSDFHRGAEAAQSQSDLKQATRSSTSQVTNEAKPNTIEIRFHITLDKIALLARVEAHTILLEENRTGEEIMHGHQVETQPPNREKSQKRTMLLVSAQKSEPATSPNQQNKNKQVTQCSFSAANSGGMEPSEAHISAVVDALVKRQVYWKVCSRMIPCMAFCFM